jgi:PAS domain S-box-containing protein
MTMAIVPAKSPRKTIVLVDDDPLIREAMTELLTAKGYAVHAAKDGLEGLEIIRKIKPDYIVLDVVLPKLDGGRVCAAVRQDALLRRIPIIVFSSLSPQDYRFFPRLSADAYVAKGPFTSAGPNLLTAISHFEEGGLDGVEGLRLGYENYRPRRLVEELLRERAHLTAILRVLAPGVLELDRDGRIVMANPGACEFLGKKEAELVGELFSSLVPPPQLNMVQGLLTSLLESEEPMQHTTTFHFGDTAVSVRLAPILEATACNGLLVMVEGEESRSGEGS